MSDAIRLAKRVAETVPCSRSEAERYIAGGWVSVDGKVVEDPVERVTDEQDVTLHPEATLEEIEPVTILLHKPAGFGAGDEAATPATDLLGPATLALEQQDKQRVLRRHFTRLTLAAPLDTKASGLVVYTQDYRIARKLVEEGERVEHEYLVEVEGSVREGGLLQLNQSMSYRGRPTVPLKASWQSETRLRIAGKGIRPGQIEHMCRAVGLAAVSIKRLRIGRIPLASLPLGQWRYLREVERF
jgi:23S rRNA pseudouridine2604 synthase